MKRSVAHIHAIGTAIPTNEVHHAFVEWASGQIGDRRARALFERMAARSGITRRWSVLPDDVGPTAPGGFYEGGRMPPTSARMAYYAEAAPRLALEAIAALGPGATEGITHLVVASCTGFVAPGIDQLIARQLGLSPRVERTIVGFMGCSAAVAALRLAHHIVGAEPAARVLVVAVELSTLHLQDSAELEPLLAMLQFADGAAAAMISAEPRGLAIDGFFTELYPDSEELIRWTIGDHGFVMHLSGAVPSRIAQSLGGLRDPAVDCWAVHPGGRSILDAVETGLGLDAEALAPSRAVLAACGNMSSATLMFVLARIMAERSVANGRALAFGPGLVGEGFAFRSAE